MLNGVLAAHAHATARRPTGVEASRKVRVNVCADGCPLILPQKVVHAPRALGEVAGEARERRP
eukprot:10410253-Alexandrium_andersonii.AAC.1